MTSKNLFITGSGGKIGSFLVKDLIDKGYNLKLLARRQLPRYDHPRIEVVLGDLLDADSYSDGLKGVDAVLHLAALTHTNNIKKYYEVNSDATRDLIKLCEIKRVKRFVFVSTRAISPTGGEYSRSKLQAEKHVTESNMEWAILRLAEVYGASGKEGIDMLLKTIDKLLFVPVIGDGNYKIAPVHVRDVIFSIMKVIGNEDIRSKVYNISGPRSYTYNEFVDLVLRLKNLKKLKINIPIGIFNILARGLSFLTGDRFIAKDQVPRLQSEKSDDISLSINDLGYDPVQFQDVFHDLSNLSD